MELTSNYFMAQGQAAAKPSSVTALRNNNAYADASSLPEDDNFNASLIDKSDQVPAFESLLNQTSNPEPDENIAVTNNYPPVDANNPALMAPMPAPLLALVSLIQNPAAQNIISPEIPDSASDLNLTQPPKSGSAINFSELGKLADAGKASSEIRSSDPLTNLLTIATQAEPSSGLLAVAGNAEPIALQSVSLGVDETLSQTSMDRSGNALPGAATAAASQLPAMIFPETVMDKVIALSAAPANAAENTVTLNNPFEVDKPAGKKNSGSILHQLSSNTENPIPVTQTSDQADNLKKPEQVIVSASGALLIPQPVNESPAPLSLQTGGAAEDGKNPQLANTVPLDVSGNQQSMHPSPSQATPQGAPLMPANPVPEIKPVQNQGLAATAKSERQNDNSANKPSYIANTDKTGDAPAATANAPQNSGFGAQAQPMDTQSFVQTLSRNSDAQALAAPDGAAKDTSDGALTAQTGNVIYLDKAETAKHSGVPAAAARPETPQQHASPPVRDIALHMSQHADNGINRFQLRLDPPELGRVEVRMEISAEGKLSAVIAVERPETLDLLQRDGRALERSLLEAGLKTDGNSLSFSLKGGRHDNPQSDGAGGAAGMPENTALNEWDESLTPVNARFANRAVNIRI